MRILIASDSHGNVEAVNNLMLTENYDYFIFCGDGLSDFNDFNSENVIKVKGNCDFFSKEDDFKCLNIFDQKIFITHGNKFGVKLGYKNLISAAKEHKANIVCFGHTHQQLFDVINNIILINPGALQNKKYAELIIENDKKPIVNLLKL